MHVCSVYKPRLEVLCYSASNAVTEFKYATEYCSISTQDCLPQMVKWMFDFCLGLSLVCSQVTTTKFCANYMMISTQLFIGWTSAVYIYLKPKIVCVYSFYCVHCTLSCTPSSLLHTHLRTQPNDHPDGRPFAVTVEQVDQSLYSLTLRWSPAPVPNDAPVLGYTVLVTEQSGRSFEVTLEGNDTTVDLLHLTPGRRYGVVVFARNAYGQGVRSEQLDAYTVRSEGKCFDGCTCRHLAVACSSTQIVAVIIFRLLSHSSFIGCLADFRAELLFFFASESTIKIQSSMSFAYTYIIAHAWAGGVSCLESWESQTIIG